MATYNKRGYKSPKPEVEKDPALITEMAAAIQSLNK